MESFGITLPVPGAVDLARLPAHLIEPHYTGPFRMVAQLSRGDFAGVEAHWRAVAAIEDPNEQMRAVVRSLDALEKRGLVLLDQAQQWQKAQPESAMARLMLAATLAHAGLETDYETWDPKTTPSHYQRLRSRMAAAAEWLEPLLGQDNLFGRAAAELNLSVKMRLHPKERRAAWDRYLGLIDFAPHYEWLYLRAADYASERYSHDESTARRRQLQELALAKQLPDMHQVTLRQVIEAQDQPPEKIANPQAWRPYWESRIKAAPTVRNLVGWMYAEASVANWHGVLDISEQILAQHPHHKHTWEQRSWALLQIGRLGESYEASIVAITLGSDYAMNRIVQGFARGEMGLPKGDFGALLAHCQLGAVMALGAAYNCLGSSHTDGFSGGPRDTRAALAWHLRGARAGHFNSQHDVAVLLPRIVTDPQLHTDIDRAAGHWLRRAAAREHTAARNKLEQRPQWGVVCRDEPEWDAWMLVEWLIRIWFGR